MPSALLQDRTVILVAGDDADAFLQGLVTCDIGKGAPGHAAFGAMLTPQGKIITDFFISRGASGLLIDAPAEQSADLIKRLGFYRLRSKVAIADLTNDPGEPAVSPAETLVVVALFGDAPPMAPIGAIVYPDPRTAILGKRAIVLRGKVMDFAGAQADTPEARKAYEALRIKAGAPQGGCDFPYGDVFPHDVNMDMLNGVAFDKGCYVGQEVVSRMKHRGSARKRILPVSFEAEPPAVGAVIAAGDITLGTMGSATEKMGLAVVRTDRLIDAQASEQAIVADGVILRFTDGLRQGVSSVKGFPS